MTQLTPTLHMEKRRNKKWKTLSLAHWQTVAQMVLIKLKLPNKNSTPVANEALKHDVYYLSGHVLLYEGP